METHVEKWALTLHPEPILHLVQNIFIMDTDYVRHVLVLNRTRIILNVVELKNKTKYGGNFLYWNIAK